MDQNLPKRTQITDRSKSKYELFLVEIFEIRQEKIRGRLEIESVATKKLLIPYDVG